jgi:PTS system ascorbate-specific IIB component
MTTIAKGYDEELTVLTVCGVGMGSSLILRMTAEDAFRDLGLKARVTATDTSSARSMPADMIIGQAMHTEELQGVAPAVISVDSFLDREELKHKVLTAMQELGWLQHDTPVS